MRGRALNVLLIVIAIIAICFGIRYYIESKEKEKRNAELENNINSILNHLKSDPQINSEIKLQIGRLIDQFKTIDIKISNELFQVRQLLEIGQIENAIEDLVKIMEHLLTVHYQNNNGFKVWLKEKKQQMSLHNLLGFCKNEEKISEIEYQFFLAIKSIRNKEDHTLDLQLDDFIKVSGIITGIGGIHKIGSMTYPGIELLPATESLID